MYFSIPLFFYFRAIYIKIYTSLFIFCCKSGKLLLVPYTKGFGRITFFEVMTWQPCYLLRSALNCFQGNSFGCKYTQSYCIPYTK